MSGHGVATTSRPGRTDLQQQPRQPRDNDGQRQQEQGVAVGQTHERRLGGLRRSDQADNASIGALRGGGRGLHLEGIARIECAAMGIVAVCTRNGYRLARQRRLIDNGHRRHDEPVDRNDLAGADKNSIADRDVADGNILDGITCPAIGSRGARSTSDFKLRSARATA